MAQYRGTELSELTLATERLTLRPWQPEDAGAITEIMATGELRRFLDLPDPYTESHARDFVMAVAAAERAAGTGLDCAVVERDGGRLVGSASLRLPLGFRQADIGYWIAPAAQGCGYATEATIALAQWAFDQAVHRVELRLEVGNLASAHVALRAGFGYEGIRRDFFGGAGSRGDLAVFVRTADDPGLPIAAPYPALPETGLSDDTLTLRDVLPEDLEAYIEVEHDPVTIGVSFSDAPPPRRALERTVARARLERLVGPILRFAMVDSATGGFAGTITIRTVGPPGVGGVGYAVHPAYRGRGFTSRALRLIAAWAFADDAFARLELGAKVDNVASQRAALAAGFAPDGVRTARLRNGDGTYSDEARFALVNPRFA